MNWWMMTAMVLCTVMLGHILRAEAQNRGVKAPANITLKEMKSERRLALVIGNGAYPTAPLKNPPNDARLMAKTLRQAGFEVIGPLIDQDKMQMQEAIIDFGRKLKAQGGVGLFFFAGHGMQIAGGNYIIPVGTVINDEAHVKTRAVNVQEVLGEMEAARNRLNLVVLDACRNNPFARSFRSAQQGLGSMDAPSGTLLLYATRPGQVASDGSGDNGPFTQALARAIMTPGVKVEQAIKTAVLEVENVTNRRQTPWLEGVLRGDFYFVLADKDGCPEGTERQGNACVPRIVQIECPKGFEFVSGTGCVPIVKVPTGPGGWPDAALKLAHSIERQGEHVLITTINGAALRGASMMDQVGGARQKQRRVLRALLAAPPYHVSAAALASRVEEVFDTGQDIDAERNDQGDLAVTRKYRLKEP